MSEQSNPFGWAVQGVIALAVAGAIFVLMGWLSLEGMAVFVVTVLIALLVGVLFGDILSESRFASERQELEKQRAALSLRVHITTDKGEQWGAFLGAVSGDKAYNALRLVAGGVRSFTVRDMSGVLGRSDFEKLRGELIERGFLSWRNGQDNQQGVVFTRAGLALLRSVRESPLPVTVCRSVQADTVHAHAHTETAQEFVKLPGFD
jgi:hypothetical protein